MSSQDISSTSLIRSTFTILPVISTEKRIGSNKIRFMNYCDIPKVKKLLNVFGRQQAKLAFGNFDTEILWSRSFISILLESGKDVLATMMLNNYPNIPSIPQSSWEGWLNNMYDVHLFTPYNTAWVHLFLFNTQLREDIADAFIKFVFKKFMQVQFVVFVLPPNVTQLNWLAKFGTIISPSRGRLGHRMQRLLMLRRACFVSSYRTRRAVIEDTDDIVALLHRNCPTMKRMYGKHYIAAIIHDGDGGRDVIVAEYKGIIVAAMIATNQVNYDILNLCFHLEVLHGLKKMDSKAILVEPNMIRTADNTKYQQPREYNLSDFILKSSTKVESEEPDTNDQPRVPSTGSLSAVDFDFDIEMDVDMQSLASSESYLALRRSTESMFIGHLEINMSCVVLSYTGAEIQKFMEGKKDHNVKLTDMHQSKIVHFTGESNAFAIEAIAAARTHDFAVNLLLLASYECFPDKDYCLLSLPCNERTPPILKKFIRANTRRDITIPHELYLCHKLSLLGTFSAREAHAKDADDVTGLVGNQTNSNILSMFTASLLDHNTHLRSYVFLCNKHLIGFALIDEEYDINYIFSHYYCKEALADIQDLTVNHGKILYFTVLPIFEKQSNYFLQELHRLSDYSKLYYWLPANQTKFLPCIISDMTLAVPITLGEHKLDKDCDWEVPVALEERRAISALFISTPSFCARPRIEVNTRIVVVGASDAGLSFIITMLLSENSGRNVQYNNLTIVSAHGISRYYSTTRLIPAKSNINRSTLDMHALSAYVDVVEGVMTSINRKEKTITVSNNAIYYDILILTCGVQYQMPKRDSVLRKRRMENPENVFIVNTEVDASLCLDRLKKIWSEKQDNVIVYGHTLNAYCCISTLLRIGLPEKFLIFVDYVGQDTRIKYTQSAVFTDDSIEESMLTRLQKRGVTIYKGSFYTWEFDECERVKSVSFQCHTRRITVDCIALFAYETKYVCQTTLNAIRIAGLIFDEGLVITPEFRTNDPHIYAAGTCTRYPRVCCAEDKNQKYYNQVEIGRQLALVIIDRIMNTAHVDMFQSFRGFAKNNCIPVYKEPLYVNCVLPDALNYLCVRKPGPMSSVRASIEGEVLTTGNAYNLEDQGYFRVHIGRYGLIDEITCISRQPIDTVNLTCVWGKHETLFKKLFVRCKLGQIPDLFKFFRGDEFYAIYNHMFPQLLEDISIVLSSPLKGTDTVSGETRYMHLMKDILRLFKSNHHQRFRQSQFRYIQNLFKGSIYEEKIIEMVLTFLKDQRTFLPMYAHPIAVQLILGGYKDSDFFKEKKRTG